ncbi:hypothetical protein ACE012_04575 [Shewanella xiamenensis]|uniref:hypothetical protein n=1 Tax=Shewanella xiamenensis TaxID=332186 RepID=UPI0035BB7D96
MSTIGDSNRGRNKVVVTPISTFKLPPVISLEDLTNPNATLNKSHLSGKQDGTCFTLITDDKWTIVRATGNAIEAPWIALDGTKYTPE